MHHILREIIAALGGILFIIIGIARRQDRLRLVRIGKKAEGNILWILLITAGLLLLIFAAGLIIYKLNHNPD